MAILEPRQVLRRQQWESIQRRTRAGAALEGCCKAVQMSPILLELKDFHGDRRNKTDRVVSCSLSIAYKANRDQSLGFPNAFAEISTSSRFHFPQCFPQPDGARVPATAA